MCFDFWNATVAPKEYSPVRVKRREQDGKQLLRISETELNEEERTLHIDVEQFVFDDKMIKNQFKEHHDIRYFAQEEMEAFGKEAGFEIVKFAARYEEDGDIDKSWNVLAVMKNPK